jgi:phosphoglycolate phosphatase-like HAD superfamily hydrolase
MTRHPSRLVLFDIDGTLLSSAGVATETFGQCLSEVAGRPISTRDYSMAGKTDPQIVRELLLRGGCAPEDIPGLTTEVLRLYIERFGPALTNSPRPRLFPGVRELLGELRASPAVVLGLLTGNIEQGAQLKLDRFGLRDHFRLGAFGSDSADRRALVPIAVERAQRLTGRGFEGREVVVIGDTPLDIDCGRAWGAATVAVATGPYSLAELESHAPDALFPDFSPVDAVFRAIVGQIEPEVERREA